jgi:hypothetical protein
MKRSSKELLETFKIVTKTTVSSFGQISISHFRAIDYNYDLYIFILEVTLDVRKCFPHLELLVHPNFHNNAVLYIVWTDYILYVLKISN